MRVLGIDPGLGGAIAILVNGVPEGVVDMPIMAKSKGKGNEVNVSNLTSLIMMYKPDYAIVEQVGSMPGQGVASVFSFGVSFGVLKGVLGCLQIPAHYVTPAVWKKYAGLAGKDKDAARGKVITEYPMIADELTRKTDVDRAEAILLAAYGVAKFK